MRSKTADRQTNPQSPLVQPQPDSRPTPVYGRRQGVQLLTLAVVIVIGLQFAYWVGNLERGQLVGVRSPGVEGFLPISALISLRSWLETGVFPMVHPAGLVIFALIGLTGLLLRKAFCSWLCPVGMFAEYLARWSHRLFGRKLKLPRWLDYPLMSLKYLILFFFVQAILWRMTARDVAVFLDCPYNKVADIKMLYFFTNLSNLELGIIGALVVLSFILPYFWCRYLCPYGGLLGVLSMISPLKIRRSLSACTSCGKCTAVCPSFLKVDELKAVSSPECTGCLECVVNCPESQALKLQTPGRWRKTVSPLVFATLVAVLFYGGIGVAKLTGHWHTNVSHEELMHRVQEGLDGPEYEHIGR